MENWNCNHKRYISLLNEKRKVNLARNPDLIAQEALYRSPWLQAGQPIFDLE
jgi:hypothetical protein